MKENSPSKLRCGLYVRVSTQDQSCDMQIRELTAFAQARGWEITRRYEDKASGANPNRKMLAELMEDCRKRRLDVVCVWKLDRLFRSLKGVVVTLNELNDLGVEFVSLKDSLDLTTAQGRLMMGLIACFSEFELSLIRTRVKAGLDAARARGAKLGRPKIAADLVAEVMRLRRSGLSIRQIEARLERKVSRGSIVRILKDTQPTGVQKNP